MSYLNQLKQPTSFVNENSVMPPSLPGSGGGQVRDPRIASLRLQQMKDLARAYHIQHDPNATFPGMEMVLNNALAMGVFNHPPKSAYYFEKSKYTSDEMKQAKVNGGFFVRQRTGHVPETIPCPILHRWIGPDPEGDLKPKEQEYEPGRAYKEHQKKASAAGVKARVMDSLRKEAKALGINSWGKKREELARLIAEKKGQIAPQENANE